MPETQIIRPGVGTLGRPIQVTANAYKIKIPDLIIHHYDVKIKPPGEKDGNKDLPQKLCRTVFQELKDAKAFGDVAAVYDGRRNIYTPKRLDFPQDIKGFDIDIPEEGDDEPSLPLTSAYEPPPGFMGGRGRGGGFDRGGRGDPRGRGRGGFTSPPVTASPGASFKLPPMPPMPPGTGLVVPRTRKFQVKIEKVGEANILALTRFVKKQDTPPADGSVLLAINALNVLCNHDVMMNFVSKKGNKFFPPPRTLDDLLPLSQGLDIWRGYFSSIRMAPGGLILNFDITSQVMIRTGNLVGRLMELLGLQDPRGLANLAPRDRVKAERIIKGLIIAAKVSGGRTVMKKKPLELTAQSAEALKFKLDDGRTTTVFEYFLESHNYRLQYPTLPCVRMSKRALYPIEVCHVASGQKYNRKLDPDQLASAIQWLTVKPPDRMRMLEQGLRANFQPSPNKPSALTSWGMSLEKPQAMQLRARIIDPPKVLLKENRGAKMQDSALVPREGSWDMRDKAVCMPAPPVKTWIVVVFQKPLGNKWFGQSELDQSINGFMTGLTSSGLKIDPPALKLWAGKFKSDLKVPQLDPKIPPSGDIQDYLRFHVNKNKLTHPSLILCYFDDKNAWQYAEIKRFGDLATGATTQGLSIQKLKKANAQYYGNVALKVNAKLGGLNQSISPADMGVVFQRPTMILGADVAHPAPGSLRPSVAAVVASMNKTGTGYVPDFSVQASRAEMIVNLDVMVKRLLLRFKAENKVLPQNIIFYRDGVSEGQFSIVLEEEIPLLRKAFYQVDPKWTPRLTFIVCGKRHHYRFGAVNPGDADRSGNLKPGVVIDTDVVHPYDFDWYCQSHAGLLGTSRSAHYTVLVDDSQLNADVLQKLTYYLCFLYSRATRSVSIVTPAYYAHHVCTRAILWLNVEEDDSSTVVTGSSQDKERQLKIQLEAWQTRESRWRTSMSDRKRQFSGEFWM